MIPYFLGQGTVWVLLFLVVREVVLFRFEFNKSRSLSFIHTEKHMGMTIL